MISPLNEAPTRTLLGTHINKNKKLSMNSAAKGSYHQSTKRCKLGSDNSVQGYATGFFFKKVAIFLIFWCFSTG